jgi:hypothetical protein
VVGVACFEGILKVFGGGEAIARELGWGEAGVVDAGDTLKEKSFVDERKKNDTFPWVFCSFTIDLCVRVRV